MHLLAAQPGEVSDGTEAIDLGQDPGEIVVLSAADTELALLSDAAGRRGEDAPSLRLANTMQLGHNLSVDTYVDAVVKEATVVVARLLGGAAYWRYGTDEIAAIARENRIALALLPGDDKEDQELRRLSTVDDVDYDRLWAYLVHGGAANADAFLSHVAGLAGRDVIAEAPELLPRAGCYRPGIGDVPLERIAEDWLPNRPVAAIVFYRALVQAGDTAPVDALVSALADQGLNALPLYSQSLKDPAAAAFVEEALSAHPPSVIVNCTGFALASPDAERGPTPFDAADCPILQAVLSGGTRESWDEGTRGLAPRDIAMNVALPEVDGRIMTRAISFKSARRWDAVTQTNVVRHEAVPDRVAWTATLAAAWARLRRTPENERQVVIVLANYPNKDARIGNGVGLDTPASAARVLGALGKAGYIVDGAPSDGTALIETLLAGPTNDLVTRAWKRSGVTLPLDDYRAQFDALPEAVRAAMTDRWGAPENDPHVAEGAFQLSIHRWGNVVVGMQPARGYNIDPKATYHDPDLVPPHGYLAFYMWLTASFGAHAVIHLGKHGNLEWLPGKALALSDGCFPETVLAPVPHLYPFIVNDPGEGTQAKRRTAAVIVDHLTPPLARAETYGHLRDLEALIDEYFEAGQTDPRRLPILVRDILELCASTGLDQDCGIGAGDDEAEKLTKLDGYLCELKEMQIRDGLHVFGTAPDGGLQTSLLVALTRVPRGNGSGGHASLTRALAGDLGLGFDPLAPDMASTWTGSRPDALVTLTDDPWRTMGDTVERLELLASALIDGTTICAPAWTATAAVLAEIEGHLRPVVEACGTRELDGLLAGLGGRFVVPGPSGAPSRGRPDVLPTGRNFYSVDTRAVPTPAAWRLGWASATRLIERHAQEHGDWPRAVALSAWGTANMRTGGDDIAQALALMGVQPTWEPRSGRVTGFEIMPSGVLGRPRVDVTLRVSGFFRDAFPSLIDLVDSAARAVAMLDEDGATNPLAACAQLEAGDDQTARRLAATRVFGSKPGAYGAGLQALIDEGGWNHADDLARAYVAWSGYAYGAGKEGAAAHALFEERLGKVEAIVHNQDNREHDLLDSDDYYQFEGGLAAAVRKASGLQPAIYHNDHSCPENPRIRTLTEEIARVVRARVVNPKWIAGVMRHGYKGAFEMAATVDYLFGFASSARCVPDHHFDAVFDAYLDDDEVRDFLEEVNPDALRDIAARLSEAQTRGLWTPRRNSTAAILEGLIAGRSEKEKVA
ncbi:MAG: cobaltochelatase subunit CobN [Rhodospirillales bacterium]|nr:cobaltochelatase subunit CobN [Rhodospirillales bacterium]